MSQQFLLLYNESVQFPIFQQDVDLTRLTSFDTDLTSFFLQIYSGALDTGHSTPAFLTISNWLVPSGTISNQILCFWGSFNNPDNTW